MAKYVIGDLQGCYEPFKSLLDRVGFDPSIDHLFLVGDLIARGPDSLSCVEYILENKNAITVTLGNHDLHLIACYLLNKPPNPKDKLESLFASPLLKPFIEFLLTQPLALYIKDLNVFVSHAGIHPDWTIEQALEYSAFVSQCLNSPDQTKYLEHMYGLHPLADFNELTKFDKFKVIVNVFTRMRYLNSDKQLNLTMKSAHSDDPELIPWFSFPRFSHNNTRFIFGHWAALEGKTNKKNVLALDTGYVWGGTMTMFELLSGKYYLQR